MSVIAVGNLPSKLSLQKIVKKFAWLVKGDFEALNCVPHGKHKTCYIKLSERLDPQLVVEILKERGKYNAFVPDHVPDLHPSKNGKLSIKMRRSLGIIKYKPVQVFIWTNYAILKEMQSKFNGLFNLSRKTGHRLLEKLTVTVMDRLKQIQESNNFDSCFHLSMYYRKLHPHFGDFQLILSTLHALQDAAKVPRAQLVESDLIDAELLPVLVDKVPFKVVEAMRRKYSEKIVQKIVSHIEELDADVLMTDSADVIARKKISKELKNISPYLNMIIKQVIANQFVAQKSPYHRITIYGEPTLPQKSVMMTFLKKFHAVKVIRSDRMYNMIRCNVPASHITALQDKDGTLLGELKLIIRASDIPQYKIPKNILEEIKAYCGETATDVELELTDMLEVEDEEEEVDEAME